ncbi:MAG: prepilin-type N-terminal cleavage/methylation domain-containing protein [Patescibacteria group bacterium]
MNNGRSGFTIVEMLIVIVIIAILAAITIVAFNAVSARADTTSRLSEMKAWERLYKAYAASYGRYPAYPGSPDGDSTGADMGYCLGTGFPDRDGTGTGNCRDLSGNFYQYNVNSTLNSELRKIGSLPTGIRTSPGADALGPFAKYHTGGNVIIFNIFKGGTTCPSGTGTGYIYPNDAAITCFIDIPEAN